jgi:soluble lytic murein transglycosylase
MQLMLPTARETARRVRQPFEAARLTSDGAYNAALGAAHLADLARDFRGSYVLMFAAYNAGGGNVARWIRQYGDPRDPDVDVIDWIERIPFSETRNYVQRVMENVQVYRARLGAQPLAIAQDLARGQRIRTFAAHDPRTDRSMDWTSAGP